MMREMRTMIHAKRRGLKASGLLGAAAGALLLSGCVSIGAKPPQRLLTLDATHKVLSLIHI